MKTRLLNLWPHRTRSSHPESSLIHEILSCALVALLLLATAFVGLRYYLNQSTQVNLALQNELSTLVPTTTPNNSPSSANSNTAFIEKLADWKQQSAGRLDWMSTLNDAASPSLQFIEARQEGAQLTLTGKASTADAVAQLVATLTEQYKTSHQVKLIRLDGKTNTGSEYWLFETVLTPNTRAVSATPATSNTTGAAQ